MRTIANQSAFCKQVSVFPTALEVIGKKEIKDKEVENNEVEKAYLQRFMIRQKGSLK